MEYTDKSLTCSDCGMGFTFSASEQEFFASKGFVNEPGRCPDCRAARKQNRGGGGGYGGGALGEQAWRNQQQLDETLQARNIFPQAMQNIGASPVTQGMTSLAGQVAGSPTSIDDATKARLVGVGSDAAVRGYNESRRGLRNAMSSAGMADSPSAIAKETGLSNRLSAQLQGIRRGGEITQATTNLSDRLRSLAGLGGAQSQLAQQQMQGAMGGMAMPGAGGGTASSIPTRP